MKKTASLVKLLIMGVTAIVCIAITSCSNTKKIITNEEKLPKSARLKNDKPKGKGWVNLIENLNDWNAEKPYWSLDTGTLHGDYAGGKLHNYAYTKTTYTNYELNAVVRMSGKDANSGVCIRIKPTNADNAPGYQIDMGPGYWGCLFEERKAGMVQKYPKEKADKLVQENEW